MPGDNLRGIEPIIWAAVYARAMPSVSCLTREEWDRAMVDAELEADLHIERRRDRETVRQRPIVERNLRPHERSARAVDGEQTNTQPLPVAIPAGRSGDARGQGDSATGSTAPVHGEAGSRGPRTILEDIGFLPRKQRPADPEDQGDDDLNY